ncbi:MAG: hypothetical protein A3C84_03400 [Candidatus Ryanbacteria bacterium RIFCSPHIGHO2_02_FULL_48_12]|uniref:POTRA domain-containing protein n=1 Tax=Candidatus Ryanbacteria bacterium RIFCSPHIGHO2_01_FULL_48_27 TaxID=1802115 RepID=A0A1G2G6I2_9BACT|nr:MAG: hypothetical protein A2756_02780 [Candidatus Ryanbacteria bacterium RIFCSPHIGHO2_01_FULL_48_27]OGZ49394.1 MAG: hypothetical protein A3C84_03400 [Candidatus Ryanbacteria bacterium RIFCSPHIGHO2_02_FULL_48_12]
MSSVVRELKLRQKKRRTKERQRHIVFGILGLLACMGVFFIPQFRVTTVSVSGLHVVSPDDVERVARTYLDGRAMLVYPRDNFFLVPTDDIARAVREAFPRVIAADVSRSFPHSLFIKAQERQVTAIWCMVDASLVGDEMDVVPEEILDAKRCFYLDESGIIFESAPGFSGSLIAKVRSYRDNDAVLGTSVVDSQTVRDLALVGGRVRELFGTEIKEFMIGKEYKKDLQAITEQGWYIRLEEGTDMKTSLDNLRLVLAKEVPDLGRLEYADARFPGKIFYKVQDK